MNVANNVISLFQSREKQKDWAAWENSYAEGAELLAWAFTEYKKREAEWQSESR